MKPLSVILYFVLMSSKSYENENKYCNHDQTSYAWKYNCRIDTITTAYALYKLAGSVIGKHAENMKFDICWAFKQIWTVLIRTVWVRATFLPFHKKNSLIILKIMSDRSFMSSSLYHIDYMFPRFDNSS